VTATIQIVSFAPDSPLSGHVYEAKDIETESKFLVKVLSKISSDGTPLPQQQRDLQLEEIRLRQLASGHPNILSLLQVIEKLEEICLVFEYYPGGSLFEAMPALRTARYDAGIGVFLQILSAVKHCHNMGIYLRDLNPRHMFLDGNLNQVKLTEFRLATSSEESGDIGVGFGVGMLPYMAPGNKPSPL